MSELPPSATLVVVTSVLRDAEDHDRFVEVSRSFLEWLQEQPGFLRYELFRSAGGGYCDTMLWETPAHAEQANALFEATPMRAAFASMVSDYNGFLGTVEPLDPA